MHECVCVHTEARAVSGHASPPPSSLTHEKCHKFDALSLQLNHLVTLSIIYAKDCWGLVVVCSLVPRLSQNVNCTHVES